MSAGERKGEEIRATWIEVYKRQGGICAHPLCDKQMVQLAHVLAQDEMNLRLYGPEIVHHPLNLRGVCGLKHNQAMAINRAARPLLAQRHVEQIRKQLEGE